MTNDRFSATADGTSALVDPPIETVELHGLNLDHFFPEPTGAGLGTPVLIDKDGDAELSITPGALVWLLEVKTAANATLGIHLVPGSIELTTPTLVEGSKIIIDGKEIGRVLEYNMEPTWGERILFIEFNWGHNLAAQKLIRSLTYTSRDDTTNYAQSSVKISVTIAGYVRTSVQVLTADHILGDDTDNVIEVASYHVNMGDEIIGGAGNDVLKLTGGGSVNLTTLSKFEGIETVQGSDGNDYIRISTAQIASLKEVNGGGQAGDYLRIVGTGIDLRGKVITGFTSILNQGGYGTIIVDNASMAKMFDGSLSLGEKMTVAGGTLSDADRIAIHQKNIDTVIHNGRTTTLADLENKTIKGTTGKNTLKGSLGNDKLYGGYGNDKLTGGYGKDVFVFNSKLGTATTDRSVNLDTITDFNAADDTLWLDNAIFKKLGSGSASAPGKLKKGFFKISTKAGDKNDFILYNKSTGYLSYDADGSGSKYKPVEFAKIAKNLKLTHDDFRII